MRRTLRWSAPLELLVTANGFLGQLQEEDVCKKKHTTAWVDGVMVGYVALGLMRLSWVARVQL